jgi:integrase
MWWLRLRSPGKVTVHSLRTPDKTEAELRACPLVARHKALMLAARPVPADTVWRHDYAPGLHDGPDGGKIFATATELHYMDASGKVRITGPNGSLGFVIRDGASAAARPSLPVKTGDDDLLETYLKHAGVTGLPERQARNVWHTFKTVVGKPLSKCTRDDGRALVAAFGNLKSATAHRRMVPMVALCNLAIAEGKLTFNPFAGCTPKRNDSKRVLPFSDADVELIRANLGKLDKHDALLVRVLATMGVRRGEAFAIDREQTENGVRYVMIGETGKTGSRKTDQSLRRVPLPADLLKHLPKKISGPLFTGRLDSAGKRLRKWLGNIGISDPAKAPMHSFRHRAKDKLRAAGAPLDVQYELLGHEVRTVAAGYGRGSPVPLLKKWLDKIGM